MTKPIRELVLIGVLFFVFLLVLPSLFAAAALDQQYGVATAYLCTLIAIWIFLGSDGFQKLGLQKGSRTFWLSTTKKSVLVFFVAVVGFIVAGGIALNLNLGLQQADMSSFDHLRDNLPLLLLTLLAIYITSSFGEEVIYRGFLITKLQEIFGHEKRTNLIIILVAGIIFGLAHYHWGWAGVIQTTFMGWVLGYFYLRFHRNLWITILAHAYMDTLLIAQMY